MPESFASLTQVSKLEMGKLNSITQEKLKNEFEPFEVIDDDIDLTPKTKIYYIILRDTKIEQN